jgi:Protein of unknown function (DUF2630)
MNDKTILDHIGEYVDEEHALRNRGAAEGGLTAAERDKLEHLQTALDQCWDLLDQRRALRSAGRDPNDAALRDPATVKNYLQ